MEQRFIEIKFYLLVARLFKLQNNVECIYALIDALALYKPFNISTVKKAVVRMISDRNCIPFRDEVIVVLHKKGISNRVITAITKANNNIIKNVLHRQKIDPIPIYPRWTKDETKDLKLFIDSFNQFNLLKDVN